MSYGRFKHDFTVFVCVFDFQKNYQPTGAGVYVARFIAKWDDHRNAAIELDSW